jgi:hypothetical protein
LTANGRGTGSVARVKREAIEKLVANLAGAGEGGVIQYVLIEVDRGAERICGCATGPKQQR